MQVISKKKWAPGDSPAKEWSNPNYKITNNINFSILNHYKYGLRGGSSDNYTINFIKNYIPINDNRIGEYEVLSEIYITIGMKNNI